MPNEELKKLIVWLHDKSMAEGQALFKAIMTDQRDIANVIHSLPTAAKTVIACTIMAAHSGGYTEGFLEARGIDQEIAKEALTEAIKEGI